MIQSIIVTAGIAGVVALIGAIVQIVNKKSSWKAWFIGVAVCGIVFGRCLIIEGENANNGSIPQASGEIVEDGSTHESEKEGVKTDKESIDAPEGSIRLIDGKLGEYGKQDPVYSEYVDYYLFPGRYKVENNTNISIVMIIDDDSNDEISRLTLGVGQSGEIDISIGQHIELLMYSDVTLMLIN